VPLSRLPDRCADGDLVLRLWTVDAAPALHAAVARNVEHLRPWMPWIRRGPEPVEVQAALIAQWRAEWQAGGDGDRWVASRSGADATP
jgi:hypothetical protein